MVSPKSRRKRKMDMDDKKEWDNERATAILKAAYDLQNLCKTGIGCRGCPFQKIDTACMFRSNPAIPCTWDIEEKTVYTVKLPET